MIEAEQLPDTAIASPVVERDRGRMLLRTMLLIRRFEEKSAVLYTQGRIHGFLHLCVGEEAVAVGALTALTAADNIVSTYREHGHALARGMPARVVMAEIYGKAGGCCRGRGGSMHLFDAARHFYGGNAIVGAGLPVAVGLALADQMQKRPCVTACIFGDGAVAEGEFHESLNLAALWKLPVLFICENNLYAMGTHISRHQAQTNIAKKADGYGLPGDVVDGMDVLAVQTATRRAVESIRKGTGPRLLEARTYRFRAHSMYDPELYRDNDEVEQWKLRDPITTFVNRLREQKLLHSDDLATLESEVAEEISAAVTFAEASPLEPAENLMNDLHTPVKP
jgi:pyruvate dehydrogenase E1 component alpha subunit